jgi:iron complex outermembrane recepter protein
VKRLDWLSLLLALGWCTAISAQAAPPEAPPDAPTPDAPTPDAPIPDTPPDAGSAVPPEPPAPDASEVPTVLPEPAAADSAVPLVEPEPASVSSEVAAGSLRLPDDDADIVVTGTRIQPKTSFGQAAPVQVVDRKLLQQSGVTNLADSVQYLTVTQGTGAQGGVVGGQGTAAVSAASAINLRGLGVGATLLLLNGRRVNPSANGTNGIYFADLSAIPLAAIERIEILKAGAAAIYGADAVGGVVNVITRRNWDGARLELNGKTTTRTDLTEYTASASFGASSERGRVMAAMSYFQRDELELSDRYDLGERKYVNTYGYPSSFYGLGSAMTAPSMALKADPACGEGLDSALSERVPVPLGPTGAGEQCQSSYGPWMSLLSNAERANVFSSAEYDLGDHVSVFAELGVSRYRGDNVVPTFPIVAQYPVVPADHVDNPFGEPLLYIGRPQNEKLILTASDDTFRTVIGIKGDLGGLEGDALDDWTWELSASFGVSRFRRTVADNLLDAVQSALGQCSDPNMLENCFNPFYSAVDGTGTPNSQTVLDRLAGRQLELADHALQIYNAGVTGSVLPLPGGDLGIAFGAEIRREWRVTEFDHDAHELRYGFLFGNTDATADRDVYSGYLELRLPFVAGIELQAAARLERYTDTDASSLSPFAGLTITPSELLGRDATPPAARRLQLRANASRAYRAPTIFNTYPGFLTLPLPLVFMGQPIYIPVRQTGNEELEAENAVTFSGGIVWSPIQELSLTVDVWRYDYENRIEYDNPQQIIDQYEANLPAGPDDRVVVSATGAPGSVVSRAINVAGSVVTSGLDFDLAFSFDAPAAGQFRLGLQGTYTFVYDMPRHQVGNSVPDAECEGDSRRSACHLAGKRNFNNAAPSLPRFKANIPLTWRLDGHAVGVIGHYISSYEDDLEPNRDGSLQDIPAWFGLDLQYAYTLADVVGEELTFMAGCENLLDNLPPTVNGNASYYDEEVHDPRGRMVYVKAGAEF